MRPWRPVKETQLTKNEPPRCLMCVVILINLSHIIINNHYLNKILPYYVPLEFYYYTIILHMSHDEWY